ncbi:stimulator of interferon genes protein homolog isoform X1 [Epargyreus clarus]|uniref:stimulator of interferon genes protein homolog isoform X1 n=1 Tax=Epargyreus clarus TaxID=520877 RepID=UPI003C2BA05C
MTEKHKIFIYIVQILFVCSISYGSQSLQLENVTDWGAAVARYVIYLLLIKGSHEACILGYNILKTKKSPDWLKTFEKCKPYFFLFGASTAALVYLKQKVLGSDFLLLFIGYLIKKYPEMEKKPTTINYGTGMACGFVEGYLSHVIPSDGAEIVGLVQNMTRFEDKHNIVFPVKRLIIVITKSLYCPPDLKAFNKENRDDLPHLEARQVIGPPDTEATCDYAETWLFENLSSDGVYSSHDVACSNLQSISSLQDVQRDVAGVKNRTYRNSVYKIVRPGHAPVSLAAECATPLHTLHRVMERRALYEHLANVDVDEVVQDFCSTLQAIIDKSPDYRGKCELVYYDDTDTSQNLADVLLDKIRELEPNFENIKRT